MEVTRFGQWPWQLLGVGWVCRPGEGQGRESWCCLGIFVRWCLCVH